MERRWAALAILTAARTCTGLQFQSVSSIGPLLTADLGLSYADLGLLIGFYFLPGILVALPSAALGRRLGDRRVASWGLALMAAGGLVAGLGEDFVVLAVGRLVAGVGAVTLNVLATKMVADWFAGREVVLAMAILVNSFPIGIGIGLLGLGALAGSVGWNLALMTTSVAALIALLLLRFAYVPHANDGSGQHTSSFAAKLGRLELLLISLAGAIWGIFNGAFAITLGFTPTFLAEIGMSPARAGFVIGAASLATVVSVQLGGMLSQRLSRPALLVPIGVVSWAVCLLLVALRLGPPEPALLAFGLLNGLPAGFIMALPSQVLRPENRALGMGLFYIWLYMGHAALPPLAGLVQDWSRVPGAALGFGGILILAVLPLFGAFQIGLERMRARSGGTGGEAVRTDSAAPEPR